MEYSPLAFESDRTLRESSWGICEEPARLAVRETTGVGSCKVAELASPPLFFMHEIEYGGRKRTLESLLNPTDEESLLRGE